MAGASLTSSHHLTVTMLATVGLAFWKLMCLRLLFSGQEPVFFDCSHLPPVPTEAFRDLLFKVRSGFHYIASGC